MTFACKRAHGFAAAALLLTAFAAGADDARLAGAGGDADDWLTYGHGWANQRYSALDAVTRDNVARLRPAWIYQTGKLGTFPANPLVVDGVMYLTTPGNDVVALDAASGAERWRYRHRLATDQLCCGRHNRGLAWGYGRLYMVTADARFVALDATDGTPVWDIPMVDPQSGDPADLEAIRTYDPQHPGAFERYTRFAGNMAPVVHDGRVFVGVSGTGYSAVLGDAESQSASVLGRPGVRDGLRAFLSAYDAHDGRLLWRWYSTAAAGWEGEFTPTTSFGDDLHRDIAGERAAAPTHRDAWRGGGGSIYSSPSIDPQLGLVYFGTGNASPTYADHLRPGDNLYTSSIVALDVATGALRWYQQVVPHDIWGYDSASPPVLIDLPQADGSTRPVLAAASKTGWLYVLDRRSGEAIRRSEPFVPQNAMMFHRPTADGILVAPGAAGGANWPPAAWHPGTGLVYVPAGHQPTRYHLEPGKDGHPVNVLEFMNDAERWGTLSAIDPRDGTIRWQARSPLPLMSGALATAGGLVFAGESNGDFSAFDAADGTRLWHFATGAGVNAPAVTYRVGGRQYVVVAAGGHALFDFPQGDAVIAFALPE
ncbi:MAG: PQQ-binding-like beta-propeller repeat protein [Gammaproteobacteria bacterium]|nr:PQQ-binding-like beta-propeller repeat protein [Gammaproteobacteria bacterium]